MLYRVNKPYVKKYSASSGSLLNPIITAYVSPGPNRRQRRTRSNQRPPNHFMQRVPMWRDVDGQLYPYHQGKPSAQAMVQHKTIYHHNSTKKNMSMSQQPLQELINQQP